MASGPPAPRAVFRRGRAVARQLARRPPWWAARLGRAHARPRRPPRTSSAPACPLVARFPGEITPRHRAPQAPRRGGAARALASASARRPRRQGRRRLCPAHRTRQRQLRSGRTAAATRPRIANAKSSWASPGGAVERDDAVPIDLARRGGGAGRDAIDGERRAGRLSLRLPHLPNEEPQRRVEGDGEGEGALDRTFMGVDDGAAVAQEIGEPLASGGIAVAIAAAGLSSSPKSRKNGCASSACADGRRAGSGRSIDATSEKASPRKAARALREIGVQRGRAQPGADPVVEAAVARRELRPERLERRVRRNAPGRAGTRRPVKTSKANGYRGSA